MSLADKIYEEVQKLSEAKQAEIIDFIEFVKSKEKKEHLKIAEDFINDNIEALKELAK
ncbi:hypothetical protein K9O30_01750 [Clostridium bowmanii]|uniref:hypothetical protein n=1 Tax=Clostridium bowmanii TaxID=132925 RepID=UPI001C0CB289|nr:hypothetical protein [Clostridium bowmanii]MBU3190306.1 hypothetical protein [Clostridium bowmanii]MCA1072482.1 hypothetical protein [Clostridium bowmanii]